jgi:hypothetical protein
MRTIGRRGFVAGWASALVACHRSAPPQPLPDWWNDLTFEPTPDTPDGERAFVLSPPDASTMPILVALHGRAESRAGIEVGASAWLRSYELDRQYHRLLAPPLTADDLHDMTSPVRLAALNRSLARAPFLGIVTACPYAPDLSGRTAEGTAAFGRFVVDQLLPLVRSLAGAPIDRTRTAIDGISMGGRDALLVGLSHPETFGAVGALQPAIHLDEAPAIAALAKTAMAKQPVKLRLLTSEQDDFLVAVKATSELLTADGTPHELTIIPGPHGYGFNRGPGGFEMLLWHERAARGLPSP